MKKNIKIYLLFLIALIIISITSQVDLDGIWGYGFCYNISQGLLPYKDFNMVIGPLYPLLFSIPMHLFGNYYYLFELEHCIIYAFIFTLIYNKIEKKAIYILLIYGACLTIFGYNLFCVMMMLTILVLIDSKIKYKDIILGILIGIILMIKHNIGLFLLLVYIYDNRKKLYNLLSILVPIVPILIYLLINNLFDKYIDFCFLGMGNFLSNLSTDFMSVIPYVLLMIPLIKDFIKNKKIKALYVIAFQIIVFPIFDQGHIIPGLIPVVYYYLSENICTKKFLFLMKYFIIIGFIVTAILKSFLECNFILDNNYLKYQFLRRDVSTYLESYSEYIDRLENDNADVYLLIDNAYIVKLYRNEKPSFYDLINRGNLGSDEEKYIDMMDDNCKDKRCYYILDYYFFHTRLFDQRNDLFKNYVLDNGKYVEDLPSGDKLYINNN